MPKRRTRKRIDNLRRTVEIRSFEAYTSLHVHQDKGGEPKRAAKNWILLHGALNEPVKGHMETAIRVVEDESDDLGPNRPAGIGHVLGTNLLVTIYVPVATKQFDRLWALASGGRLCHAHLIMTPPHYGSATVVSMSFSSEPIE